MVKYHVAKVIHEGEENAKALLPYIREADVVCEESALATIDEATYMTRIYSRNLHSNNRTKFQREMLDNLDKAHPVDKFTARLMEDCWRSNKPILPQEWWSHAESVVHVKSTESWRDCKEEIASLRIGDFEKAYNALEEQHVKMNKLLDVRDEHIAQQALLIPARLREFYGINNFDGNVLFVIGAAHRLEQKLVGETRLTLMDDYSKTEQGVIYLGGDTPEEHANSVIAQIIFSSFRGLFDFIPELDVLRTYSRPELESLVRKINEERRFH